MRHIVNSGTAATLVTIPHFDQFQTGDGLKQNSRWILDALGVDEVASILVSHALFDSPEIAVEINSGQKFADVLNLMGETLGPGRVFRIVVQQFAILFEVSPASRRVNYNRVELAALLGL